MNVFQAKGSVNLIDRGGGNHRDNGDLLPTSNDGSSPVSGARLGLWIFIGMASILFSAIVSAYIVRMGLPDWRMLPEPAILWANTFVLILSSVALQWAANAAKRNHAKTAQRGLLVGGGLALLFMLGQLWAWRELNSLGYFVATNPANTFFYMITGLHAAHLVGGLIAWWRTQACIRRGDLAAVRESVGLCALYWHFLLVVWLVLFGMMLFT